MDEMGTSTIRNGQAHAPPAGVAASAGDVLTGRPFFGTLFRKGGRGQDPVHLATIPEEEPITFAEAREEIDGFHGEITLHTIADGEHVTLTFNAGAAREAPTEPAAPSREPTTAERAAWIEKGRQQAEQENRARLRQKEEHYEQRIHLLEQRRDHYRELWSDAEDEKIRLKQQHQEELDRERRRHQEELDRLRQKMDELKEENNQLYIENRLSKSQGSTLDRLIESLAERAPDLLHTLTQAKSRMLPASTPSPNASASESSAVGRPNPSSPAAPHTPSKGSASDRSEDGFKDASSEDQVAQIVDQVRQMKKPQLLHAMAENAVAAATGELPLDHFESAVRLAEQVLAERGEAMAMADWVDVVEQLAQGAIERELSAEAVAEAIEPIVRRFLPAGSMAEKMLRRMPAKQAANMLIDAAGRNPAEPVRELIAGVLARFKETL